MKMKEMDIVELCELSDVITACLNNYFKHAQFRALPLYNENGFEWLSRFSVNGKKRKIILSLEKMYQVANVITSNKYKTSLIVAKLLRDYQVPLVKEDKPF